MSSTNSEKWDRRFLKLAEHIAGWSLDPSTKVGAVVTDIERRIMSCGYNGLPRGVEDTGERLEDRTIKLQAIIHAEENCLLFAHSSLKGCTIFTWPIRPCASCASKIIQSGITRVVAPSLAYARWEKNFRLSGELLSEAGVEMTLYKD